MRFMGSFPVLAHFLSRLARSTKLRDYWQVDLDRRPGQRVGFARGSLFVFASWILGPDQERRSSTGYGRPPGCRRESGAWNWSAGSQRVERHLSR